MKTQNRIDLQLTNNFKKLWTVNQIMRWITNRFFSLFFFFLQIAPTLAANYCLKLRQTYWVNDSDLEFLTTFEQSPTMFCILLVWPINSSPLPSSPSSSTFQRIQENDESGNWRTVKIVGPENGFLLSRRWVLEESSVSGYVLSGKRIPENGPESRISSYLPITQIKIKQILPLGK